MFNSIYIINYSTMNAKRCIAYVTHGVLTGSVIAVLNLSNIKRSPEYGGPMVLTDYLRFGAFIGMKGFIYGLCYPIALFTIAVDGFSKKYFDRHFIPFSRYHTKKINKCD